MRAKHFRPGYLVSLRAVQKCSTSRGFLFFSFLCFVCSECQIRGVPLALENVGEDVEVEEYAAENQLSVGADLRNWFEPLLNTVLAELQDFLKQIAAQSAT